MDGRTTANSAKVANGINVIAGLWLMISAYFFSLGFSSNEFIVGLIVAIVSLIGWFSDGAMWVNWVDGILGVWLLLSPLFTTGISTGALWNSIILGIIVLGVSLWGGMSSTASPTTHGRHGTTMGM